jgi:hypothetical protein
MRNELKFGKFTYPSDASTFLPSASSLLFLANTDRGCKMLTHPKRGYSSGLGGIHNARLSAALMGSSYGGFQETA